MESEKTPRERAEDLISLLVSDWRPTRQQGLWAIRIAIVLGLLVAIGYAYGVTLWDWMKLLIVPAVIAAGGLWYNRQQQERQQEDDRRQQQRGLEIEDQRAQDTALEAYLHQMSQLLTDKDRPLHTAQKHDTLSIVAWAWTKTVLRRIGPERKGNVLRFVNEAGLINKDRPVFSLSGADLREADLQRSVLRGDVNLPGADLSGTNLSDADLSWASLIGANLHSATLGGANLSGANLSEAVLSEAYLVGADLSGANLTEVVLSEANLTEVVLSGANLSGADLSGAVLSGANLFGASVADAKVTQVQLAVAESLEGATMPNGQKYEDWLKDREKSQQDQ